MSEMDQDPADLASELRASFAEGDGDRLRRTITDDVVWHVIGEGGGESGSFTRADDLIRALPDLDRSDEVVLVGRIDGGRFGEVAQFTGTETWDRYAEMEGGGSLVPEPASVGLINRAYDATKAANIPGLRSTLSDAVKWHTDGPGLMGPPSEYDGIDAVMRYLDWKMRVHLYDADTLDTRTLTPDPDPAVYTATHRFVMNASTVSVQLTINVAGTPRKIAEVWQTFP